MRLELGIGLEIENQDVLTAKTLAARVNKLAGTQENFDSRILLIVTLSFLFVFLFFGFFLGLALLVLLNALLDLLVFFFLLFVAKRLAVFFHQRRDFIAVQIKESGFARLALLHFSFAVVFGFFFRFRTRVVFLDLVDSLLVIVNFFEKSLEVWQFDLRLDREIENALADRAIDHGARQSNVVFCSATVEFDLARKLDAFHRPVVLVKKRFLSATDRGGFFHDEVGLGIEEHLAFHPGSARNFNFQGVFAANLHVAHKLERHLLLLGIHEPRVVILSGGFQLSSLGAHQCSELSRRIPVPGGFAVVGFDQSLLVDKQFQVVAIGQFGIESERAGLSVVGCKGPFQFESMDLGQGPAAPGCPDILFHNLGRHLGTNRAASRNQTQKRSAKEMHDAETTRPRCSHGILPIQRFVP